MLGSRLCFLGVANAIEMDILTMLPSFVVDVAVSIRLQVVKSRSWECVFIVLRWECISVSYVLYANVFITALNAAQLVMRMNIVQFCACTC